MSGMDTDGVEAAANHQGFGATPGGTGGGGGADIVQGLLQQFNCLGTTDHDELVGQMLQILGFELSYATARFFLDMNDWNLDSAVSVYFDANKNMKTPSMQLGWNTVPDIADGVAPNAKFAHSWEIQNNGDETWPDNCFLKIMSINGENLDTNSYITHINNNFNNNNLSDYHRINLVESAVKVPALRPCNQSVLRTELLSPSVLGPFQAKFRLCTPNGNFFGEPLVCSVQVMDAVSVAERLKQQQMEAAAQSQMELVQVSPPTFPITLQEHVIIDQQQLQIQTQEHPPAQQQDDMLE